MQMGESERISKLVADTVLMLCKNSIHFNSELKVKGLVGVISDATNIFLVEINETFGCTNDGDVDPGATTSDGLGKIPTRRKLQMTAGPPPRKMMALMAPPTCASSDTIQAAGHPLQHLTQEQLALVRSSPAKGAASSLQTVSMAMASQPRIVRPVLVLPNSAKTNTKNLAVMQRRPRMQMAGRMPMAGRMQMPNSSLCGRAPGAAFSGQAVRKPSTILLAGPVPRQAFSNRGRPRGGGMVRGVGVRGMQQAQPVRRVLKKMNPRLTPGNVGSQIVMPSPQLMASFPSGKRGVQQSPGNRRQLRPDSNMQIAIAQPPRYSQALALPSPKMGNPPQSPVNQRMEGHGRMQLSTVPSPKNSQSLALPSPQKVSPAQQSSWTPGATQQVRGRGRMPGRGGMPLASTPSQRYSQALALPSPQMVNPLQQSPSTPTTQQMQGRGRMQLSAMPSPQHPQLLALPSPQMVRPLQQSPVTPTAQQMQGRGRMQLSAMPSPQHSQSSALPSPQMVRPQQSSLTPSTQRMVQRGQMPLAAMPSPQHSQSLALPSPQRVNPQQSVSTPTGKRMEGQGRMQLAHMPSPRNPSVCVQSGMVPIHGNILPLFVSTSTPAVMQPAGTVKQETSTAVLSPKRLVLVCPGQVVPPATSGQPGTVPMLLQVAGTHGPGGENRFVNTSGNPSLTAALQHSAGSGMSQPQVVLSPTVDSPSMKVKLVGTSSQATRMACAQMQTSNIVGSGLQTGALPSTGRWTGSVPSSGEVSQRAVGTSNPQTPGTTLPHLFIAQSMSGELRQHGTVAVLGSSQQSLPASVHASSASQRQDSAIQNFVLPGALNTTQTVGNQSTVSMASVAQQSASASPLVRDARAGASIFSQFLITPAPSPVVKVEVDADDKLVAEIVSSQARIQSQQVMQIQHQSQGQQARPGQNMQPGTHRQQQGSLGQQPVHGQNQQQLIYIQHQSQQGSHGQQAQQVINRPIQPRQGTLSQSQSQQDNRYGQQQQMITLGQQLQTSTHGQQIQILSQSHQPQMSTHGQQIQILSHGQQPQMSTHGQQIQILSKSHQPQMSTHGQQIQVSSHGQQIQILSHGQQPQMPTHGQQIQILSHGQHPQMSTHGQQIQVSSHGQQLQMSTHGQQPQMSTHGQPPPSSVLHRGQQKLYHPPNNSSPVVISDLQTIVDNAVTNLVAPGPSRMNLQQPSSTNRNLSQSDIHSATTGQQTPKSQTQQTFPGWQAQSIQKSQNLQTGGAQQLESVAKSQQCPQQMTQQQAGFMGDRGDQLSSAQPAMQNHLASSYRPAIQNQSSVLRQSSLEPAYHELNVDQLGLPSSTTAASKLSYDQGLLQPSDEMLVPHPVAVVSAGKIFQPAKSPLCGQASLSTEKPKVLRTATSVPILPADLNLPSHSNLALLTQPDSQKPPPQNLKTFIQNILENQPDRLPLQRESQPSQSAASDARQSLRNRQEPNLASHFQTSPSVSRGSLNTLQKKKIGREALCRDPGSQGPIDEFDLDAFAFSQVQKLVELKQMELEKSSEVASSTSSGQTERTVKSSGGGRLGNLKTARMSGLNMEEPAEEMPTAAVGLADRGSLVPSPISPTETIAYSEGTENGDLCFAENETPFLADIQIPTAAKGLGDQGSLVPSPISPSETIAYSEGGSPLRLEESDLEELEENLKNYADQFMLFSNEKVSYACIGCRFAINNEADLASHYTQVHTGDIGLEPVEADSRYLPLLEPSRGSDDATQPSSGISCPFPGCERAFSKISGVYNHHLKAHKVGLTKRQKKALSSKYGLIYHCPDCLRDFLSKSEMQQHMSKTRHGK